MQSEDLSVDGTAAAVAQDAHTFAVADHGIDPSDMPPASPVPPVGDGKSGNGGGVKGNADKDSNFGWRDFLVWCGIPVLVILLIRIFLIGAYVIPSGSMMDTIEIGDRVVTSKLTPKIFSLKRGDVVVFHDPANWLNEEQANPLKGDYLIKRVIGLPGDTVECEGNGQPVTINGEPINETAYIRPGVAPSSFPFSVKVSEGHVFVLGDNRANSADSRYHLEDGDSGLVPIDKVVGVGLVTFWPLNRVGVLDAHHEVFENVPEPGASSGASADAAATPDSDTASKVGQ